MTSIADPRAEFAAEMALDESAIDLTRAALLIAAEEYPDLDPDLYRAQLDEIAGAAWSRVDPVAPVEAMLDAVNEELFGVRGFRGNADAYGDPRNSYLNEVIDRGLGIPITLAIVYRHVAARLGVRLVGLNLPFHFMLGYQGQDGVIAIDAFDGGARLSVAQCESRLQRQSGRPIRLNPSMLAAVGSRTVIRRVLNNLRAIYLQMDDRRRALACIERMQLALPAVEDARDIGLLAFQLGNHRLADRSLSQYLVDAPTAPDRAQVEERRDWSRRLLTRLN
jgi:regulator of sirC expression with transglutaminase-like and TPR domain